MRLSYVIASFNRRERLLATIEGLAAVTPLGSEAWEIIVVDNASMDGSADAVAERFGEVVLIRNEVNAGPVAKNLGLVRAKGEYVIMLDDDSYPAGNAVGMSIGYLDAHPETAVVVGRCVLPNGNCEAPALPEILMGGASCVRRSVLDEVGLFPEEFFKGAEEYDLSFRIWDAGYRIERFEDVVYRHDKVEGGRAEVGLALKDLRNNLILIERYLPKEHRRVFRRDWIARYKAFARMQGMEEDLVEAMREGLEWSRKIRKEGGRRELGTEAIEALFGFESQREAVRRFVEENEATEIAIAGYAKTLYVTYKAAWAAGVEIKAILEDHPAFVGGRYRGVEVTKYKELGAMRVGGVLIANVNPAQVFDVREKVEAVYGGPVLQLWEERRMGTC